jgi:hypothetical protein
MEHMTETGAALANFIAKKTCSPCADGQIADYIAKIRVGQCYPIFPVALFQDAAYVGRIILSEFSHMISIAKNGKTAVGNETLDIDARSVSLQQLLISAMRKNNGLRGVS